MHDDALRSLIGVGQILHPLDGSSILFGKLQPRDLLRIGEHLAHVLAFMIAHQNDRATLGTAFLKVLQHRRRVRPAIDQVANRDNDVIVGGADKLKQLL